MDVTRRKALLFGGGLGMSTLSGCAKLPFVGPQLTLTLLNFDSEPHSLNVEILRAEGGERSESKVFQEFFKLPPLEEDGADNTVQESNVLESRKYAVRANLRENESVREKYLFYPDCTGNDEPNEELYIEINREEEDEEPYIKFQQNWCGSDSWWF